MSALAIFREIPTTKADMLVCIGNVKEEMLSGNYDIIELHLHLKKVEELVKGLLEDKEIKTAVRNQLDLYPENTVKVHGCEITKVSRSNWLYDLCGDKQLYALENQKKEIDEEIEALQKQLQVMRLAQSRYDTVMKKEYTVYPASKTFTETFSIKIL